MKEITEALLTLAEPEYADFEYKLTPTLPREAFLGVRVPKIRNYAKAIAKTQLAEDFLNELPHKTYDENILHSVLLASYKPFDECLSKVEAFLPYVDNWAVCDTMRPKVFAKNKTALMVKVLEWTKSDKTYTIRFGVDMLMTYFLDGDFDPCQLDIPAGIVSEEYYVNMMIAWYYATALAKQWDATIPVIESKRLGKWVHNKSIQKAIESYRITDKQKEYLRTLRV